MKQQKHKLNILLLILCVLGAGDGVYARNIASMQAQQLQFIENQGQIVDQYGKRRADIDFRVSCGQGLNIFIGSAGIHYQWTKSNRGVELGAPLPETDAAPAGTDMIRSLLRSGNASPVEMYRMDVMLVGANANAPVVAEDKQSYYEQYYLPQTGGNAARAHAYRKITYKGVYPDIDWVVYIKGDKMEYDFVVHPGGKVSDIKMKYGGAASLGLNEDGSITAVTEMGTATQRAPYSFQAADGGKVDSRFILNGDILSFGTGDHQGTLIIDPVLEWGRYYGGSNIEISFGTAVDNNDGSVYMSGTTLSTNNIATIGAFKTTLSSGGAEDFFLARFSSAGLRVWSTYYGGTGMETGGAVTCDRNGNVYLSGSTSSTAGMTTPGSFREVFTGGSSDGFIVKFDASGSRIWGSYYGGEGDDGVLNISCDVQGNVYICGNTSSDTGISTPSSHQVNRNIIGISSSAPNGFLVKFDGSGMRQWGTYYGWNSTGLDVFADKFGDVYLAGDAARDSNITTPGAHQRIPGGSYDYYLAKFDGSGTRIWGTFYGGEESERAGAIPWKMRMIAGDDSGNIYLAGTTGSVDSIATPGSYQDTKNGIAGETDGFLVKFDSSGKRQWGTYYGGAGGMLESVLSMACDHRGNVYLVGTTESNSGIATPDGHQTTLAGTGPMMVDAFLARFDHSGALKWGTYYGGSSMDLCFGVVTDWFGNVYISGSTQSDTGIATPGSQFYINEDAFIAKFCFAIPPVSITGSDTICPNTSHTYSVPANSGAGFIWEWPAGWDVSITGNTATLHANQEGAAGTINVQTVKCGDTSDAASFEVYVHQQTPAQIAVDGYDLSTVNSHSTYQWYVNGYPVPGATGRVYTVDSNAGYNVKVTNANGCTDSSDTYYVTNISVTDVSHPDRVAIYPNPARNMVYVAAPERAVVHISSMDGKTVLQQSAGTVDISGLADGVYLLQVHTADDRLIHLEKLVKSPR